MQPPRRGRHRYKPTSQRLRCDISTASESSMIMFIPMIVLVLCLLYLSQKIVPVHIREPESVIGQTVAVLDCQHPGHVMQSKIDHVPPECEELVVVRWAIYKECALKSALYLMSILSLKYMTIFRLVNISTFSAVPYPREKVHRVHHGVHQLVELHFGKSRIIGGVDVIDSGEDCLLIFRCQLLIFFYNQIKCS